MKFKLGDVVRHKDGKFYQYEFWIIQKISEGRKCQYYYTIYPYGLNEKYFLAIKDSNEIYWESCLDEYPELFV